MPDEDRLTEATARAVRAQELLDNELLREAFRELENRLRRSLAGHHD